MTKMNSAGLKFFLLILVPVAMLLTVSHVRAGPARSSNEKARVVINQRVVSKKGAVQRSGQAASRQARAGAPAQGWIMIEIKIGRKMTQIEVQSQPQGRTLRLATSEGMFKERKISEKDFAYIYREASRLSSVKGIPKGCFRSVVKLQIQAHRSPASTKASCFGEQTSTSAGYVRLVNTLVASL